MDNHETENLWPHGENKPEPEKFFALVKELADAETLKKIELTEKEYKAQKKVADSNGHFALDDMPDSVLDGRLGEICEKYMAGRFPRAYAWSALLAIASGLVPRHTPQQQLNLYVALVGPLHSGKSQAIGAATQLLGCEAPILMKILSGSAEQLVRRCKDAQGAPRLASFDELGHLLDKSKIENASFPYILNRAFYDREFEVQMGKKESTNFNASLSMIGGMPDNRFEDLFSHATTGGLYDRFMFGACPGGFEFDYFPFEEKAEIRDPVSVYVHRDVWLAKSVWIKQNKLEPRVVEIALRAAAICAAFDGRTLLGIDDLKPCLEFAKYQQRIRMTLRPNEGENIEGKVALRIISYLKRYEGRYVTRRKLLNDIGAHRFGPSVAERILSILHSNAEIEVLKKHRPVLIRLLLEDTNEEEG